MHEKEYKYITVLYSIILLSYVWRSLIEHLVGQVVTYALSLVVLCFSFYNFILIKKDFNLKKERLFLVYFVYGIIAFIISSFKKGIIISTMGFCSIYMNMLIWFFSPLFDKSNNSEKYRDYFIKIFIFSMVVNSVISIYQYYVDASVFGIVGGYYGNDEILGQSFVTRRAVGFMGSPQSYSVTVGLALYLVEFEYKSKKKPIQLLLLVSGILSGSRAFGIFLLGIVFCKLCKIDIKTRRIVIAVLCLVLLVVNSGFITLFIKNETYYRMFEFNGWSALKVYFNSFKNLNTKQVVFGNSFGLPGWIATVTNMQFDYSSTESYFVSLIYQIGVLPFFVLLVIVANTTIQIKKINSDTCLLIVFLILMFCTPAFAGFGFSYVGWFAFVNIIKKYTNAGTN